MPKKALIILSDGFEDIEAVSVIDVLTRAGIEVIVAGLRDGPVHAAYGTTIVSDTTIDKIEGDFDAIVFPGGGKNADALAGDARVVELVRKYDGAGKIVAAICAAPSHVLAEAAGILRGRRSSGDPVFNNKLTDGGAILTDQPVTVDGNIITGMGPGAALEFALTLAEHLDGSKIAGELARKWRLKE